MSHGIQKHDKGFVFGTTWHNMPQYITQDHPVSFEQAMEVMSYPLEKVQLYREVEKISAAGGTFKANEPVEAWAIMRPDINEVLVPAVGKRFEAMTNDTLLSFVKQGLLDKYPELCIESVGTLKNGATSFLNLKLDEYHIKGDDSPTLNRLMYSNPLGVSRYRACAHTVRIVCNNTLQAAVGQGAANHSLSMIRHTSGAAKRLTDIMVNLASIRLGLQEHRELMDHLATVSMNMEQVTTFLDDLFVIPEGKEGRSRQMTERQQDILRIFEEGAGLSKIKDTKYAMLQAVTQHWGTFSTGTNADPSAIEWDALTGYRANSKKQALQLLCEVAA